MDKQPKSHWKKTYEDFIAVARDRENELICSGGYYETHHIRPTSLKGGDEPANLLAITAEEHFYCHYWLAEIHGGNQWEAVRAMVDLKGNRHRGRQAIRTHLPEIAAMVAKAREESAKAKAANAKLLHQDPDWLAKLHNPETQQKRREAMQNQRWYTNGKETIRLYVDEPVPEGYEPGKNHDTSRAAAALLAYNQSDAGRELKRNFMKETNPMHNPESLAKVAAASKAYHLRPDVVTKQRERMLAYNPMMTKGSLAKAKASNAKAYAANPLNRAKTPVVYEGKTLSLRQAAKRIGVIDSNITRVANKRGITTQEAFDWYALKTPEERRREVALARKGGVDWRGEHLLSSEICERHGLNYHVIYRLAKKLGVSWVEAAERRLAKST